MGVAPGYPWQSFDYWMLTSRVTCGWSRNDIINKISPDLSIMDLLGVRGQPGHLSRTWESGVTSRGR